VKDRAILRRFATSKEAVVDLRVCLLNCGNRTFLRRVL
jgi:hypothetical protein